MDTNAGANAIGKTLFFKLHTRDLGARDSSVGASTGAALHELGLKIVVTFRSLLEHRVYGNKTLKRICERPTLIMFAVLLLVQRLVFKF